MFSNRLKTLLPKFKCSPVDHSFLRDQKHGNKEYLIDSLAEKEMRTYNLGQANF